jgi:hypothetical protein
MKMTATQEREQNRDRCFDEALKFCFNLTTQNWQQELDDASKHQALRKYHTEPTFHAAVRHLAHVYLKVEPVIQQDEREKFMAFIAGPMSESFKESLAISASKVYSSTDLIGANGCKVTTETKK